ncbi:Ubiquitin-conjugating enzyme E2 J2 [Amphibalanus amphitrite]|uniref:Ubiquitin-conjugating enzyme E2 J2 n=1 Tax=Amphibalanus amphitrite TaxID=1232801 RepID=A0A6A4WJK2_AMPAM|nr:ubiquitin-conjugating enzyme E2 J2-like [Amphibalanus amphitrite]XP_043214531.1 ubiquitin-conjugating enzyme E2 J2-like [Amphibalanus amphitrite]XP_043214532.1 ubiquitin-conjugating enzyme E2 J2-like [Amphibalanus amphitrite]XP_043214533.1 ubiquitin-conjugating enzyme E2 J2-like [Amphibalanus amphitrite]KAF0305379.1 Ubiquitin-conjugating enzyme E2 J2 [Amphibalanus amphitrite]
MGKKLQNNTALVRLRRDYMRLKTDPVPYISAEPLPSNILEWHYIVRGPEGTPYAGGLYHGMLRFPVEYPFRPPSIYMITPNGRFKPNTRLCLSISDFHPDTWNPSWSVSTILTGLLSFMLEVSPTVGSIETSDYEKRIYAHHSLQYNLNDATFCELFPDDVQEIQATLARRRESAAESAEEAAGGPPARRSAADAHSGLGAALSNLIVMAGFVLFAGVVHYVVTQDL